MIIGVNEYAELYPWIKDHILNVEQLGKVSIASQIGVSPISFLLISLILSTLMLALSKRKTTT